MTEFDAKLAEVATRQEDILRRVAHLEKSNEALDDTMKRIMWVVIVALLGQFVNMVGLGRLVDLVK